MDKKNGKKYGLFALLIAGIIVVSSLSSVLIYRAIDNNDKQKQEAQEAEIKDATAELKALMEDEDATIEEIEKAFDKYFPKLDKETATGFIDSLAYLTHYNLSIVGELNDAELALVYQSLDQDGIYNPELMVDESLKEKLDAIIEYHALIAQVNGEIIVAVDYGYFVDTYGEYMAEDYKAIFDFYEKEQKEDYIDAETDNLMCDVVLDRITTLDAFIVKYSTSSLKDVYKSTRDFYIKEYLGLYSTERVYDDELKLKDYILESYKKVAKDKESPIYEDISDILKAYENSGYVRNAEVETLLLSASNTTQSEYEEIKEQLAE